MVSLPEPFEFEFAKDWASFRDSRVRPFLSLSLRRELDSLQRRLESVKPDDLQALQGSIQQVRKFLAVIETSFMPAQSVKEIVEFSKTYGRY